MLDYQKILSSFGCCNIKEQQNDMFTFSPVKLWTVCVHKSIAYARQVEFFSFVNTGKFEFSGTFKGSDISRNLDEICISEEEAKEEARKTNLTYIDCAKRRIEAQYNLLSISDFDFDSDNIAEVQNTIKEARDWLNLLESVVKG